MYVTSALITRALAATLAAVPAFAVAAPDDDYFFCGTNDTNPQVTGRSARAIGRRADADPGAEVFKVPVYIHVVQKQKSNCTNYKEFLLSRDTINRQMDALNDGFKDVNINFNLMDVDWTRGELSLRWGLGTQLFKNLHKGDAATLNIYYLEGSPNNAGITDIDSGCLINENTVPGGSHPVWNEGKTTVHEVGHWLGLSHTDFTEPGDCEGNWRHEEGISDEPCGTRCDHNFMSYGEDKCLSNFTASQISDMHQVYTAKLQAAALDSFNF